MTVLPFVNIHSVFSEALVTARLTDVVLDLLMNRFDVGLQVVSQSKTLLTVAALVRS